MSSELIPADIAQFITEKIDSVAFLEALLLLRSNPEHGWSIESLSRRLYIDEKQTAELLTRLGAYKFVAVTGKPPLYQYDPGSTELRQMVDRLAGLYSKQLVPVTGLIHSQSKMRVREFADAFKFRKDD
jgi:hypothetical protein